MSKNEQNTSNVKENVNKAFNEADKELAKVITALDKVEKLLKPYTTLKGLGGRYNRFNGLNTKVKGSKDENLRLLESYNNREVKEQEKALKALKRETAKAEKLEKAVSNMSPEMLEKVKAMLEKQDKAETVKS